MMQKNASNIVVKTVCELNIQVKNYDGKTSVKKNFFCSLSLHLGAGSTRDTRDAGRLVPGLPIVIGSFGLPIVLLYIYRIGLFSIPGVEYSTPTAERRSSSGER